MEEDTKTNEENDKKSDEEQESRIFEKLKFMRSKHYWGIIIILLVMWFGLILFFYLKADEVTRDPCSICAERMGENVVCQTMTQIPARRIYYSNGSIDNVEDSFVDVDNTKLVNQTQFSRLFNDG